MLVFVEEGNVSLVHVSIVPCLVVCPNSTTNVAFHDDCTGTALVPNPTINDASHEDDDR